MRNALALLLGLLALPAHAWQAGIEGRICTLEHQEGATEMRLTYDPAGPLYSIAVRQGTPWAEAPVFGIRFSGAREITITTRRHNLSEDGRTLSVTDRGFGNVLDGLEFNETATAFTMPGQSVRVSLAGAAPEVQAFRDCTAAGLV